MGLDLFPQEILDLYEVHEWRHAAAILREDFRDEWDDLLTVLTNFRLLESDITTPGGRKSPIADKIDSHLYRLGWEEREFETSVMVDDATYRSPTHKVDCYKNGVAIEIEWNNKDPFFDRDLNNFRLLFELRTVSVGIIITRSSALDDIFRQLGRYSSYGQSTTHMSKLIPRIEGGGGGGCPILAFGITPKLYVPGL